MTELAFKEWLLLDEGFKRTLRNAAIGAAGAAAIAGPLSDYLYRQGDNPVINKAINPHSNFKVDVYDLDVLEQGTTEAVKNARPAEKQRILLKAGIDFAKRKFGATQKDIKITSPGSALKSVWGDDYPQVHNQAKSYYGQKNLKQYDFIPNPNKTNTLTLKVLVSKEHQEAGDIGECLRFIGAGQELNICLVRKEFDKFNYVGREELTHSMQNIQGNHPYLYGANQKDKAEVYNSRSPEFAAKLAELKRWYYQKTGDAQANMEDILTYYIKHGGHAPFSTWNMVEWLLRLKEQKPEEYQNIINMANEILPALVRNDRPNNATS